MSKSAVTYCPYTFNEFDTSDDIGTGLLRLFRCSALREHENAVFRLRLGFPRQRVTTFGDGCTTFR